MEENNIYRQLANKVLSELSIISHSYGYSNPFGVSYVFFYILSMQKFKKIDLKNLHRGYSHSNNMKEEIIKWNMNCDSDDLLHSHFEKILNFMPDSMLENIASLVISVDDLIAIDIYPIVFDQFLNDIVSSKDFSLRELFQPAELYKLIYRIANLSSSAKVYNPFAGLASFTTFMNESQFYFGQEVNIDIWALGRLRFNAYDRNNFYLTNDDSFNDWNSARDFDLVLAFPPLNVSKISHWNNMRHNSANWHIIENGINNLNENGKLICVFPLSFLFGSANKDKGLRRYLVENNFIETIIMLPPRIMSKSAVSLCVTVLSKKQNNDFHVRMVDATKFSHRSRFSKNEILDDEKIWEMMNSNQNQDFVKLINIQMIIEQDYDLHVTRYFIDEDVSGTKIETFASFITGGNTISTREMMQRMGRIVMSGSKFNVLTNKLVRIKDLSNDPFNSILDLASLDEDLPKNGVFREIKEDCLLVASRFTSLKPTYFKYEGESIFISPDVYALKVDEEKCDIRYLIFQLHSEKIKEQLDRYTTGQIMPYIKRNDLLQLKIDFLEIAEQEKAYLELAQADLSSKAHRYGVEIQDQLQTVNDENSFLRHEIAGSLKNVRSSFRFVQKILREQVSEKVDGLYHLRANDILDTTLETYLTLIEKDLESINKSVNRMGAKIELSDLTFEKIDLLEFIQKYAESLKIRAGNVYEVSIDLDLNAIEDADLDTIYINADKDILSKTVDNLVENALKHAFSMKAGTVNKIRIEMIYDFQEMKVQVDVCNNGKPLPEDVNFDSLVRKGSSIGRNGGDGTGLWYVNEVMKLHGGEFGIMDETGPGGIDGEFVTSMELTFPIIEE